MSARRELLERLARLAAEQAVVLGQLAALEDGAAVTPAKVRRKRVRTLYVVGTEVQVDEVTAAHARRALNRYQR